MCIRDRHTTKSGVAQFAVETEEEGIQLIRQLLSYMPQNNMEDTPMVVCTCLLYTSIVE